MGSRFEAGDRYTSIEQAREVAQGWNRAHGVGTLVRYRVGQTPGEQRTERPALALHWMGRPVVLVYVPESGQPGGLRALHLAEVEVVQASAAKPVPDFQSPPTVVAQVTVDHLEARQRRAKAAVGKSTSVPRLPDPWTEGHFEVAPGPDGRLVARVRPDLRECSCERGFRFDGGTPIECWRCKAIETREGAFAALRLQPGGKRARWTFETLDHRLVLATAPPPPLGAIRASTPLGWLKQWADRWESGMPGPLLGGHTGRGKSHIAAGLQRYMALAHGVRSTWVHWPQLLERLRQTFRDGAPETKREIVDPLTRSPIVVLDDLQGSETARGMSTWVQQETALLLERLGDAGTTVVATTNVANPKAFVDAVGDAAASRLSAMTVELGIGGEDYRARAKGAA